MQKRLAIATVGIAVCLVLLVSGAAGAYFEKTATSIVWGQAGDVSVTACNVKLAENFQPGDTQWKNIKVTNTGSCPIVIYRTGIESHPWFMGVRLAPRTWWQILPGRSKTFRLFVKMSTAVGNYAEGKSFSFKIYFYARNLGKFRT